MKTITEVEVSVGFQVTRFCTQPKVEQALADYITKIFKRTYDSPFLKAPVIFQVGMFSEKEEAKKILLGQFSLSLDLYSSFYIFSFQDGKLKYSLNCLECYHLAGIRCQKDVLKTF